MFDLVKLVLLCCLSVFCCNLSTRVIIALHQMYTDMWLLADEHIHVMGAKVQRFLVPNQILWSLGVASSLKQHFYRVLSTYQGLVKMQKV